MKLYITFILSFFLFITISCKNSGNSSSEKGSMEKLAEEESKGKNLPDACKEDLEKLGKYLDEAKVYIEKQGKGEKLSDTEKQEWERKSMEIGKEFQTSALAYTDPDCAQAVMELQTEFTKVMMEMATKQIQQKMGN